MDKVTIENSTLYHGDCRDIINDLQFDSIVTDPPYGLSKVLNRSWNDFGKILNKKQRRKNLHSGGTWAAKDIYKDVDWDNEAPDLTFLLERGVPTMLFGGNYFVGLLPSRKWIVWDKGEQFYRRSFAECELCYCNFDGNARIIKCHSDFRGGFVQGREKVHPTQKPVAVMRFCISELPKGSGNIICDPYMGSGTTGIAAIQMGRAFIGIEQKKNYFDIACKRIERACAEYRDQFPEVRDMDDRPVGEDRNIEAKKLFD
jgi:site-specific DNA-methyltransferase (adenine-specific)/modification methylase